MKTPITHHPSQTVSQDSLNQTPPLSDRAMNNPNRQSAHLLSELPAPPQRSNLSSKSLSFEQFLRRESPANRGHHFSGGSTSQATEDSDARSLLSPMLTHESQQVRAVLPVCSIAPTDLILPQSDGLCDRLKNQLARLSFEPSLNLSEQKELETIYIHWAEKQLTLREQIFGPKSGYDIASDMPCAGKKAIFPIAYEAIKGFISGIMRTPMANLVASDMTRYQDSPQTIFWQTMLSGTIAGLGSFVADSYLLPAMDRCARAANLPRFQPVDVHALLACAPPVHLQITPEGNKRYWIAVDDGDMSLSLSDMAVTKVAQDETFEQMRDHAQLKTAILNEHHWSSLLGKPTINSAFNIARTLAYRLSNHTHPRVGLFATKVAANGCAGGLFRGTLEFSKAFCSMGQTTIPDLLGGQQRINLFTLKTPDPTRPPLRWSDASGLPNYVWQTVQEGASLLVQSVGTPLNLFNTAGNLVVKNVFGNLVSRFSSVATSELIGSAYTHEATSQPTASLSAIQQAIQTIISDITWNSWKNHVGSDILVAKRLDRKRKMKAEQLWKESVNLLDHARPHLQNLLSQIDALSLELESNSALTNSPNALTDQMDLEIQLTRLRDQGLSTINEHGRDLTLVQLTQLPERLKLLGLTKTDSDAIALRHCFHQAIKNMQRREAIRQWLRQTQNAH